MNTPIGKSTLGEMLPHFILIGFLALFVIFCIKMISATSQQQSALKAQGISIYTTFHHVNGLPIAENLLCNVLSYPDRIEFKSGTSSIELAREKITDMCIKTDVEIQNQAVSSVGGAIAGGALFGPLGAIIGGRSKTKKVKTSTQYLIITYTGEQGELKYIGFDITNNPPSATKLVKEFRELNVSLKIKIEL